LRLSGGLEHGAQHDPSRVAFHKESDSRRLLASVSRVGRLMRRQIEIGFNLLQESFEGKQNFCPRLTLPLECRINRAFWDAMPIGQN
jgi:hypothetical protein